MSCARASFASDTEIEPRGSSSDCWAASLGTFAAVIGHCPGMLSTNQSARVSPCLVRISICEDGSSMERRASRVVDFDQHSQPNDTGTIRFFQPNRRPTGNRGSRRR